MGEGVFESVPVQYFAVNNVKDKAEGFNSLTYIKIRNYMHRNDGSVHSIYGSLVHAKEADILLNSIIRSFYSTALLGVLSSMVITHICEGNWQGNNTKVTVYGFS